MSHALTHSALKGAREAIPLLGGYIPVSLSFGLVATQAGFTTWEAAAISLLIYAGASQFLFVGMIAAGFAALAGCRHDAIDQRTPCGLWP